MLLYFGQRKISVIFWMGKFSSILNRRKFPSCFPWENFPLSRREGNIFPWNFGWLRKPANHCLEKFVTSNFKITVAERQANLMFCVFFEIECFLKPSARRVTDPWNGSEQSSDDKNEILFKNERCNIFFCPSVLGKVVGTVGSAVAEISRIVEVFPSAINQNSLWRVKR